MTQSFAQTLAIGGKTNSLGLAEEVVQDVLSNKNRVDELYDCLFESDSWLRMRAADSLEKVCRIRPEWFEPYVERLFHVMGNSSQPSLQWHLAQMLGEIRLTPSQQLKALHWLGERLEDKNVDWIVAANAMTTLVQFTKADLIAKETVEKLIKEQQDHRSQSVRKRAAKLLAELES